MKCRGVLSVVVNTPAMHIPPWYWFRLNRNVELLTDHGAAMMAGTMIQEEDSFSIPSIQGDVGELRRITIGAVGGGFFILYGTLILIVWRGSNTTRRQQLVIEEHATQQVEALNRLLQNRINVLFNEISTALRVARTNPACGISGEYHELVEVLSALVAPEHTG